MIFITFSTVCYCVLLLFTLGEYFLLLSLLYIGYVAVYGCARWLTGCWCLRWCVVHGRYLQCVVIGSSRRCFGLGVISVMLAVGECSGNVVLCKSTVLSV